VLVVVVGVVVPGAGSPPATSRSNTAFGFVSLGRNVVGPDQARLVRYAHEKPSSQLPVAPAYTVPISSDGSRSAGTRVLRSFAIT